MSHRIRVLKRLLFQLLLTASLLIAPLFAWVRLPILPIVLGGGQGTSQETDESFVDDAEWEVCLEQARLATQTRVRSKRRLGRAERVAEPDLDFVRGLRFALVVDVRRIKPRRLFAPPYLSPRVVRLLS